MNAAPIDIPPSLLSYVVARSMPDFHRSLFPRERKKGGKEKEKIVKFFKAGGEGKDVPNFLDEVRYLVVDNDSRSLAFSSRRIERLAKIEEAFCSIFDDGISMPRISGNAVRKKRNTFLFLGTLEAG